MTMRWTHNGRIELHNLSREGRFCFEHVFLFLIRLQFVDDRKKENCICANQNQYGCWSDIIMFTTNRRTEKLSLPAAIEEYMDQLAHHVPHRCSCHALLQRVTVQGYRRTGSRLPAHMGCHPQLDPWRERWIKNLCVHIH
jgi:hypothetical protein